MPPTWKLPSATPSRHQDGAFSTGPNSRVRRALKSPKKIECSWCTSPPPSLGRARPAPAAGQAFAKPVDHHRGDHRREAHDHPPDGGREQPQPPPQGETDEGGPKNGRKPEFPVKAGGRNRGGRGEAADES